MSKELTDKEILDLACYHELASLMADGTVNSILQEGCDLRDSLLSFARALIAAVTDSQKATDEQLLEEYSKEIYGNYYQSSDNLTVAELIDSHKSLRNLNIEWTGAFKEASDNGYRFGYEMALRNVADNTIQYEDLRKMTIQELANLIGSDCE